jgi:septal ring factor EnvC (AmiA/AmiB activator)
LIEKITQGKKQISLQQKNLGRRLRTIYKEGDLFSVKFLFSSEDFTDLLRRAKYLDSIMAYDRFIFSNYESELADFYNKKEVLFQAKGQLLSYKNAAITKKKEIVKEKVKKKQFLAKLTKEKSINIRLREELVNSSKNLNQLISRLENKIIQGEGLDIIDKKGSLLPPVKGKILNNFGRKRDKKYNTHIVHNGVSIRVRKGTPVRSVFNGKVLYTGTLEGYGNIIIIGHGKSYHSLYGHLDEIISITGKTVRPGQIIARSGDSGSVIGEALYFEMRYKGGPIEPTAWLSQSSN